MRKASVLLAIFATLLFSTFALSSPASADPNGPGNNGTVKVVDDKDDPIGADDRDNDPHVCHFHLYGFHFDSNSSGTWQIKSWAPTGNGSVVASGTWKAGATGEWAVPGPSLPNGHYKLFAKQTVPATPGGDKQKVFWIECGSSTTGGTGGTTGGTTAGTGGTTAGTGGTGGTTAGTGGTTAGTGGTGGTTAGTETSGGSGAGSESNTATAPNGMTIFKPGSSGSAAGNGTAVRGFESAPSGNAVGAVSPIVELPGGSSQSPNGAVNGVETSPVAGVQSLPSTSTDGTPSAPFATLGLAIIALGGVLLRRKDMTV